MSYFVSKRRNEVKRLFIKGYKPREIAEKLSESYYVILNDIREIKSYLKNHLLEKSDDLKNIFYQINLMIEKYKQIEQRIWDELELNPNPSSVSSLLSILTKINTDVSKLLRLVEPDKIINIQEFVQINILPVLKKVGDIIETYVPEDKRFEAINKLQQLTIDADEIKHKT